MKHLYTLAEEQGVVIERWPLTPPLEAVYIKEPGLPPIIAMSSLIAEDSPKYRAVLAHELGHHFTTAGDTLPCRMYSYANRVDQSRVEYRANKWAADFLIPWDKLSAAIRAGIVERWEIAEHFRVTEKLVEFKLSTHN